MLSYLRISNFAIIEEVELTLGPGLTVLSGETGAGKSLILDAVALLRGGRASTEVIRSGAEEARIEALFVPEPGSAACQADSHSRAARDGDRVGGDLRRAH